MKHILSFIVLLLVFFSLSYVGNLNITNAGFFYNQTSKIPYCNDNDCGLKEGIKAIEKIDGIETQDKASIYIQNVIKYLLGFLALLGTIMIIYAGFLLLTGIGDEEKVKKTKNIIIYVIIGMVIIFLAGPIIEFVLKALQT